MKTKKETPKAATTVVFPDPKVWTPYPYQRALWNYLARGGKRACVVWHRRAGKDMVAFHWLVYSALKTPGVYWYIFPQLNQARISFWEGFTIDGSAYKDFLPKDEITAANWKDARIVFKNGSIIHVFGSRAPDTLRGAGVKGVVFSEYTFLNEKIDSSVVQPMLLRSNGFVIYLYTPSDTENGSGEDLYNRIGNVTGSFRERLTVDDTADHEGKRLITKKQISDLRKLGTPEGQIQREYYCNFDSFRFSNKNARRFFYDDLQKLESDGRLGFFRYNSEHSVDTYWDIGIVDNTVIWFVQKIDNKVYLIDLIVERGKGVGHYLGKLRSLGYSYGTHTLPHDANRRSPVSLKSLVDETRALKDEMKISGAVVTLGRYDRNDLIAAGKDLLSKCYVAEDKCALGIEALYEFDEVTRKKNKAGSSWFHDITDAFFYVAIGIKKSEQNRAVYNRPRNAMFLNDRYNVLEV